MPQFKGFCKATLIKRSCELGTIRDDVPEGYVYIVYPETIKTVYWINKDTGEKGESQVILAASRGNSRGGWFPLDCLKLGDS